MKTVVYGTALLGDEAAAFLPVLGPAGVILGAVLTTGVAVHGWTSSKFSQREVRGKLAELDDRLLFFLCLLARLEALECPICLRPITPEGETVRLCKENWHCFHAACLREQKQEGNGSDGARPSCCSCSSPLEDDSGNDEGGPGRSLADYARDAAGRSAPVAGSSPKSTPTHSDTIATAVHGTVAPSSPARLDDDALWRLARRLDNLAKILALSPRTTEDLPRVAAWVCLCETDLGQVQAFVASDADLSNVSELVVGVADARERLQSLATLYEDWRARDFVPLEGSAAAEFEELLLAAEAENANSGLFEPEAVAEEDVIGDAGIQDAASMIAAGSSSSRSSSSSSSIQVAFSSARGGASQATVALSRASGAAAHGARSAAAQGASALGRWVPMRKGSSRFGASLATEEDSEVILTPATVQGPAALNAAKQMDEKDGGASMAAPETDSEVAGVAEDTRHKGGSVRSALLGMKGGYTSAGSVFSKGASSMSHMASQKASAVGAGAISLAQQLLLKEKEREREKDKQREKERKKDEEK
eukprot:TRINITY_DN16762_c0_g2_i1.p1 TRINITY_DN16762_c0_g2~~TRINITY_DN16762_c0_g2_i1.p1  ORF type:complete len:568 (+),score=135.58 TRINITY_DN16762_c0_g2_i1:102-1706(+)